MSGDVNNAAAEAVTNDLRRLDTVHITHERDIHEDQVRPQLFRPADRISPCRCNRNNPVPEFFKAGHHIERDDAVILDDKYPRIFTTCSDHLAYISRPVRPPAPVRAHEQWTTRFNGIVKGY